MLPDLFDGLIPAHTRHHNVHKHYVGQVCARLNQRDIVDHAERNLPIERRLPRLEHIQRSHAIEGLHNLVAFRRQQRRHDQLIDFLVINLPEPNSAMLTERQLSRRQSRVLNNGALSVLALTDRTSTGRCSSDAEGINSRFHAAEISFDASIDCLVSES